MFLAQHKLALHLLAPPAGNSKHPNPGYHMYVFAGYPIGFFFVFPVDTAGGNPATSLAQAEPMTTRT
jgi:hypothetical protein